MSSAGFHKFKDVCLDRIGPLWFRVKEDTTVNVDGEKATRPITGDKLSKPRNSRYVVKTDKENYTAADLLLRGIVWTMRFAIGALIAYFIYDRTK